MRYKALDFCGTCDKLDYHNKVLPEIHIHKRPAWMLIGEAPGEEEAKTGIPFVGRSGKLLRKTIQEVGIDSYIITNVLKCRPPNNRTPEKEEIKNCFFFLEIEIDVFRPEFIVCVGAVASQTICEYIGKKWSPKYRGKAFKLSKEKPFPLVFFTYHPSYILRTGKRGEYLKDWQKIVDFGIRYYNKVKNDSSNN